VSALAAWLQRQERSHPNSIDLGLARVREVAARLQLLTPPHRTLTVGGTNGKGSTVAFLDALLRAAGLKVGRFTSPHLARYNERICIDGVEAADDELIASFARIDAARGDITLTFFEYNALAALDLFARAAVDVAVLEVGLGGRLDATNIIDADVAVVCSIGIDHVDWLGSTAEAIGREKAGIFRAGRPAVLGSADMPRSVYAAIEALGARAVIPGRDYQLRARAAGWDFDCGDVHLRELPPPALRGELQLGNAATALAALVALLGQDFNKVLPTETVARALREVRIRGRFQSRAPAHEGDVEWILDVAHNVPAAEALRANLATLPKARTLAVCAVLGDKDIAGILAAMAPAIDGWVLAGLQGPRAVATRELAARLPAGATLLAQADDVVAACRAARAAASPGDRIVVFGSFLTVGPALEFLGI
jgi:dihydrofolate synthase / folylpolyglutamate synthase